MDSKTESKKYFKQISKTNKKVFKKYNRDKKKKNIPLSHYKTNMKDEKNLIEIDNLKTFFYTDMGIVKAVNGISYNIPRGKTVAIVGESGCGKSVSSLSLMRLIQGPSGQIVEGEIRFNVGDYAIDLTKVPIKKMQDIRGKDIAMIFQEPMTSLNPVFKIGNQINEVIELHNTNLNKHEIKEKTINMLKLVGIPRAEGIYNSYPHELSGGMRQRVMIAMALACDPKMVIADEPTTALDVTIQAQILDLLRELKNKIEASILLITHDLGVVAEMADYVIVMYAGRIVEQGTAREIYLEPKHPYTIGLLKSKPVVNKCVDRLYTIPGCVPNPIAMPNHCFFRDRCDSYINKCDGEYPCFNDVSNTHKVACWLYERGRE